MSTVVILGGGISGLSAVYYLQRLTTRFKKIILLESSERLGGWVNSRRYDDGTIFELGPRSLRPAGVPGINSVDLAEELGLENEVLAVSASAAASRNRFIYMNDRLNQVPNSIMSVIRTVPPFSQPLMLTVMKEMFKKKLEVEDESIHSFISRRFGEELADTAVDPIFRGIFAGDIRQLSVKSCMPEIFKMEQKHGSIVKGMIKSKRKPFRINSSLYLRCRKERWLSWSLRQGLQTLTEQMEAAIRQSSSVDIRMQMPCQQITESHGKYLVKTDQDEIDADHVISAVPAKNLSAMLTRDHADLSGHLSRISAASVVLISMEYEGNVVAQPVCGLPSCCSHGHATAAGMLEHFERGVLKSGLNVKEMQQVSMDGPNVNWAFLGLLKKKLADDFDSSIINIGSCGLHVIHNSFKTGATASGWNIGQFLSGLYYLFKDSPARTEDFSEISSSGLKPLKFANHRWLENVPVCNRALAILPDVLNYVKAVDEKKLPKPTCKSYESVSAAKKDKLILPKLHFFKFVASHLQPFLTVFQTDRPMVPFLSQDLSYMVRTLMGCFIKSDKLSDVSDEKLSTMLDDSQKEHRLTYKKVELGYLTEKHLKEAVKQGISDRNVLEFRTDCIKFLEQAVKKILDKCPLSYSLVRHLSCFNPQAMATKPQESKSRFKKVVGSLACCNRIKEEDCDTIIQQYGTFVENIPVFGSDKFVNFNHKVESERLDELFTTYMAGDSYSKLLEVVRIILVLSHGQASVERGFSINKEIEVENMKEHTLVAHRLICDKVKASGGVLKVPITKPLLASCSLARQKYEQYLGKQREEKKTAEQQLKRKASLEQLEELKNKRQRIDLDISSLTKSADQYAEKAEHTGNLTFIAKSNALRRSAKDKRLELQGVEDKVMTKQEELRMDSVK